MSKGMKEKACVDCGETYQPTSNNQKRCSDCKAKHIYEYNSAKGIEGMIYNTYKCDCGLETIEEDGVCLICKAKERKKKPIYGIIGLPEYDNDRDCRGEVTSPSQGGVTPPLPETNGGEKMAELKGGHSTCKIEGCPKYQVKEGMCVRHFNEAHGIVKKIGRIATVDRPRNDKPKKSTSSKSADNIDKNVKAAPSPHPSPSRGEGKGGGDIIALLTAERDRIDQAIAVIERYA
jgi:hypothetical protein